MAQSQLVPIPGSEKNALRGAKRIGPANADEQLEVTIRVRRKSPLPPADLQFRPLPARRAYLAHAQLEAAHGADLADMARVEAFARQQGLGIVDSNAGRRSVKLSGTV